MTMDEEGIVFPQRKVILISNRVFGNDVNVKMHYLNIYIYS